MTEKVLLTHPLMIYTSAYDIKSVWKCLFHWMDFLLSQIDLDSRHMGWVTSELPGGDHHVIKIELKGPENTLRVRQVKVLGWKEGESIKIAGQISASVAQQKNCEAETLRVFRLITSQVRPKTFSSSSRRHKPQYGCSTTVHQILQCKTLLHRYRLRNGKSHVYVFV